MVAEGLREVAEAAAQRPALAGVARIEAEQAERAPLGPMIVASVRSRVVLPAPFGPSSPKTPGPTARSTPARASVRPNFWTKFVT